SHPYGLPPLGSATSVRAITLDDVKTFHQAHYEPKGAALVITGDTDPDQALKDAATAFGDWSGAAAPDRKPTPPTALPGRRVVIVDAAGEEAQIRVAAPSVAASDPDAAALDLVNDPLAGGFSSHVLDELRVNRGLAYDAQSTLETYRHGGWISVSTTTPLKS